MDAAGAGCSQQGTPERALRAGQEMVPLEEAAVDVQAVGVGAAPLHSYPPSPAELSPSVRHLWASVQPSPVSQAVPVAVDAGAGSSQEGRTPERARRAGKETVAGSVLVVETAPRDEIAADNLLLRAQVATMRSAMDYQQRQVQLQEIMRSMPNYQGSSDAAAHSLHPCILQALEGEGMSAVQLGRQHFGHVARLKYSELEGKSCILTKPLLPVPQEVRDFAELLANRKVPRDRYIFGSVDEYLFPLSMSFRLGLSMLSKATTPGPSSGACFRMCNVQHGRLLIELVAAYLSVFSFLSLQGLDQVLAFVSCSIFRHKYLAYMHIC